jgi:hypothetical protein
MTDPYGMPPATPDTVHPHDIVDRRTPDSFHLMPDGLVELRDFGMIRRTGGLCGMMGMRSSTGFVMDGYTCWHSHDVDQIAYIVSGYAIWEYDGLGPIKYGAGDALYESRNMRHRPVELSPGLEMVVFLTPGAMGTTYHVVDERTGEFTDQFVGWGQAPPPAVQAQMRTAPWRER